MLKRKAVSLVGIFVLIASVVGCKAWGEVTEERAIANEGNKIAIVYNPSHEESIGNRKEVATLIKIKNKGIPPDEFMDREVSSLVDTLNKYQLIIFVYQSNLDEKINLAPNKDKILEWVERGGIIFFTGISGESDGKLPGQIGEQYKVTGPGAGIDCKPFSANYPVTDIQHPLMEGIEKFPVNWNHLVECSSSYHVLVKCGHGNPILIAQKRGKGFVVASATSTTGSYSRLLSNLISYTDSNYSESAEVMSEEGRSEEGKKEVKEEPESPLQFIAAENIIPNPGFEEENLTPWGWGVVGNAKATYGIDEEISHSGKKSVKLSNASDASSGVYARIYQNDLKMEPNNNLKLDPNTTYVVSLWAKGKNVSTCWFGGGPNWTARFPISNGTFEWTRFSAEFKTDSTGNWPMMILSEAPTEGLWIDDVCLAKIGENNVDISSYLKPAAFSEDKKLLKANKSELTRGDILELEFNIFSTKDRGNAEIEFILNKDGKKYAEFPKEKISIKKGENITSLKLNTEYISEGVYNFTVKTSGDKEEQKKISFNVYSAEGMKEKLLNRIQELTDVNDSLKPLLQKLENKGIDCSYQKIALTVAENFLKYAAQDIRGKEIERARDAIEEIDSMLKEAKRDLKKISDGELKPPNVPRYLTSPIKIDGPSFIATTKILSGKTEIRPVFFNGYGHFAQVRKDIEKFPRYGTNIVQIEFGPNSIFPSEGTTSNQAVKDFLKVADRASANNIAINLLLSPHYFPEWVKNKYPHLKNCSGGVISYCVDAPESRRVLEDYLRYVIPQIKDHPALHSICISNEAYYNNSRNCEFTKKMWKEWLQKKHNNIHTLNKNYNTNYSSFEDVPVPESQVKEEPIFYDWCIFNAERFAGWHKWMAKIIHEMAPNIPVHAKITIWFANYDRNTVGWGVDPELFGELSQINGNDDSKWYDARNEECQIEWLTENMDYDLQISVANKPIFNSENHLIWDGSIKPDNYVPAVHIRNVLWQGAIHGQSATTIWVWERTFDKKHPFAGSIMHMPACSQMVGITNLDLLRFSKEVSAIQKIRPQILLLYSISSLVYNQQYLSLLRKAYEGLNFCGVKIGFVTERQLAGGKLPDAKVIVIPGATHITDNAFAGLKKFAESGGRVVFAGESLLSYNEYNKPRKEEIKSYLKLDIQSDKKLLPAQFLKIISETGLDKPVEVIGDGKSVWGVEYLTVRNKERLIVNLVNYTRDVKSVKILLNGKPVSVKNLFDGKQTETLNLAPLDPVLIEIK